MRALRNQSKAAFAFGVQPAQHGGGGAVVQRVAPARRNLRDGGEHEDALRNAGMRQHRPGGRRLHPPVMIEEVEVQRARAPAQVSPAARHALDQVQAAEQGFRVKHGFHLRHGIDEGRLVRHAVRG